MMDDSSETMDHNNASFASIELVAANKKKIECLDCNRKLGHDAAESPL